MSITFLELKQVIIFWYIFDLIFVFSITGFEGDVLNHDIAFILMKNDFQIAANVTIIFSLH